MKDDLHSRLEEQKRALEAGELECAGLAIYNFTLSVI